MFIIGIIFLALQAMSSLGNYYSGYHYSFGFESPAIFFYDLIVYIFAHWAGFLGIFFILIGIIAKRKATSVDSAKDNNSAQQAVIHTGELSKQSSKQRYCKFCGGTIDHETKKCSKCGKQYFRLRITKNGVCFLIISFLVIVGGLFCAMQITEYQQEIDGLNAQIADLEAKITSKDKTIKEYKKQISEKDLRTKKYLEEKSALEKKARFYDQHIALVLNDNTRRYHKYDCVVFKYSDSSFWIYDVDVAKSRGYIACFACCE